MGSRRERHDGEASDDLAVRGVTRADWAAFRRARTGLARVGRGSTIDDVFAAISRAVPFAAGFVETFPELRPWDAHQVAIRLPPGLPELIMARKVHEPPDVLDFVARLPIGSFVVEQEALPQETWECVEGYQALRRFGLGGGATALKLRSGAAHTYLALLVEDGAPVPTPDDRALLSALTPSILAALDRLAVPLLQRCPFMAQVTDEQELGVIVASVRGVVRQANRLAHALAVEYGTSLPVTGTTHLFPEFVEALFAMTSSAPDGRGCLVHPRRGVQRHVEISRHELDPETYDLPERMHLLLLREIVPPEDRKPPLERALAQLDDDEQKIVLAMLARTTNKVIAGTMRLELRTLEKRVATIARKLDIHVPRGTSVRRLLWRLAKC